ncbi:MAG TPA: molecular chaperone TorD family protein [Bacteroidales bacterium]|nr:molecular chaperone TorD family protein [Bacteroidales bacterium]
MDNSLKTEEKNILKAYNMLLYFSGTMIMWDPSTECIQDFWKQEILKKLPVTSGNPRFMFAASALRESVDDPGSSYEMMMADFGSMFAEGGSLTAPPVESRIREATSVGKDRATQFYSSYGWESKFKNHFPDDHLGVELLFLTLMIQKYFEMDDEVCNIEMRNEIKRFISLHLLSWLPEWNRKVQAQAITKSYKGIASLILACTEDIFSIMDESLMRRQNFINLN